MVSGPGRPVGRHRVHRSGAWPKRPHERVASFPRRGRRAQERGTPSGDGLCRAGTRHRDLYPAPPASLPAAPQVRILSSSCTDPAAGRPGRGESVGVKSRAASACRRSRSGKRSLARHRQPAYAGTATCRGAHRSCDRRAGRTSAGLGRHSALQGHWSSSVSRSRPLQPIHGFEPMQS